VANDDLEGINWLSDALRGRSARIEDMTRANIRVLMEVKQAAAEQNFQAGLDTARVLDARMDAIVEAIAPRDTAEGQALRLDIQENFETTIARALAATRTQVQEELMKRAEAARQEEQVLRQQAIARGQAVPEAVAETASGLFVPAAAAHAIKPRAVGNEAFIPAAYKQPDPSEIQHVRAPVPVKSRETAEDPPQLTPEPQPEPAEPGIVLAPDGDV
jgi:hypothetical protein